jgi:SulP family sulfate permease
LAETLTSVNLLTSDNDQQLLGDEAILDGVGNGKVYIKHLYGPMFFGFTARFQELIQSLDRDLDALIIRMDRVPHMDQSGLYALEDALLDLKQQGVLVFLTGIDVQPMDMLRRIDIVPDLIPDAHVFETFDDGVAHAKTHLPSLSAQPV